MNSVTEIIDHYINQSINEDCVIELNNLKKDYQKKEAKIDSRERHEGDRRYKELTGKENPNSVRFEMARLYNTTKKEAEIVTAKHAKEEGLEYEKYDEKKIQSQKSFETDESRNSKQDKIDSKIDLTQEKKNVKPEKNLSHEKESNVPAINQAVEKQTEKKTRDEKIEELRRSIHANKQEITKGL